MRFSSLKIHYLIIYQTIKMTEASDKRSLIATNCPREKKEYQSGLTDWY